MASGRLITRRRALITGAASLAAYSTIGRAQIGPLPGYAPSLLLAAGSVQVTSIGFGPASIGNLGTLTLGVGFIVMEVDQLYITGGAPSVASISINGVAASQLVRGISLNQNGTDEDVEMWGASCTALAGNVTVNWNGSPLRGGYGLWLVTGSTGVAYQTANQVSTNNPSVSLNVLAGGAIIAASANVVGSTSTTWVAGMTKDYDQAVTGGAGNTYDSGAHQMFPAAVTSKTVSNNATGSSGIALVAVSFSPK